MGRAGNGEGGGIMVRGRDGGVSGWVSGWGNVDWDGGEEPERERKKEGGRRQTRKGGGRRVCRGVGKR